MCEETTERLRLDADFFLYKKFKNEQYDPYAYPVSKKIINDTIAFGNMNKYSNEYIEFQKYKDNQKKEQTKHPRNPAFGFCTCYDCKVQMGWENPNASGRPITY